MSSEPNSFATAYRTDLAGALRAIDAGRGVRLGGWVHRVRDLGGLVFVDLRDRAGVVQVSFDPRWTPPQVLSAAGALGAETVVLVEGEVAARPVEQRNPEMTTGDIEVHATAVQIVGPAATPAIPIARGKGENLPAEELRLRHRHLDLRRSELRDNIVLRHQLMQETRRFLSGRGYLEIETPILTKPTPEGARDYLVPSRVHPGEFYALPQSPQLYKQLLMVSGFDRYFQIARCFRDEDLRADRQPEFTQIDIEASFVAREDVFTLAEDLIAALWRIGGIDVPTPFPRMSYRDAMERYGIDRPDTRFELHLRDYSDLFRGTDFAIARKVLDAGGRIRGIVVPGGGMLSRKHLDELEAVARGAGAGGLMRLKRAGDALEGPQAKFLSGDAGGRLALNDGDLLLMVAGPEHVTSAALDRVRTEVARRMNLVPDGRRDFLWVTDFPLFGVEPETGNLFAMHHPFTAPHPDDVPLLESASAAVRALAYDVVLNGNELGGGSIRIGDPRLQQRVLARLGIDEASAQSRFGFLLEGLRSGAPPHGGIAFGFDRITMLLSGAGSLRDVIAFPKTTAARALFEGAPAPVEEDDLADLRLEVVGEEG